MRWEEFKGWKCTEKIEESTSYKPTSYIEWLMFKKEQDTVTEISSNSNSINTCVRNKRTVFVLNFLRSYTTGKQNHADGLRFQTQFLQISTCGDIPSIRRHKSQDHEQSQKEDREQQQHKWRGW